MCLSFSTEHFQTFGILRIFGLRFSDTSYSGMFGVGVSVLFCNVSSAARTFQCVIRLFQILCVCVCVYVCLVTLLSFINNFAGKQYN
jgi:hypothetical protein